MNMKNGKIQLLIVIILTMLILPQTVRAESINEYGTYSDAQKMIKEVMKDYYIKGSSFQYNFGKVEYGKTAPEEATPQNKKYLVCAAYTYTTYTEAFGIFHDTSDQYSMPRYNYEISDNAWKYYEVNKNDPSKLNGNYLIYYEKTKSDANRSKAKYIYKNPKTYEEFIDLIKPGDLFVYSGHALIAYDVVVRKDTGKKDVLILNSKRNNQIKTIIGDSTSRLSYDMLPSSYGLNNYIDYPEEGTVQWLWLSDESKFVKDGNISCGEDECAVLRIFYNDNGKAKFNFNIDKNKYNKTKLRTEYPGLSITKTSSKGDDNSVNLGDEITYTIKITNNSNVTYNGSKYKPFNIVETLDDKVSYIQSDNNGIYSNNNISWNIKTLDANKSVELKYTVKVKDDYANINKTIKSIGIFYNDDKNNSLGTGTVNHKIIPKYKGKLKDYTTCYNDNKNKYNGLELIDKVYECSTGYKFNFKEFNFENIIQVNSIPTSHSASDVIELKSANSDKDFINMILNNYWNAVVPYKLNGSDTYSLPRWGGTNNNKKRNININSEDFKDGDILIYYMNSNTYTKEKGLYAFIYLNGTFTGVNYSKQDNERQNYNFKYYLDLYGDDDNKMINNFSTQYSKIKNNPKILEDINYQALFGKNYYCILRPEMVMKEIAKISVENQKTKYSVNQKIDLSTGKLKVTYNNGATEYVELSNSNINITNFDTSTSGTKKINVSYKGYTTSYDIEVVEEYTITYKLGNGSSTSGATSIGTSKCIYGKSCVLSTWTSLGANFKGTSSGWSFAGWSTSANSNEIIYDNGQTFTYNLKSDLTLYAIGKRNVTFDSGGTSISRISTQTQYWNPYGTSSSYLTSVNIPSPIEISGWTFIGYRANNTASSNVLYDNKAVGSLRIIPYSNVTIFRSIYSRPVEISYNANSGIGSLNNTTGVQYYNSGISSGGANVSNVPLLLAKNNFSKEGFKFSKWAIGSIDGTQMSPEEEYLFSNKVNETAMINVYAIWTKNESSDDTLKNILKNNKYDVINNFATNFTIGEKVPSIKSKLGDGVTIENKTESIATGAIIKKGNESYEVVIKGDLNGDGKINSGDLFQMRKHLLEEVKLVGSYKEAGIIESKNEIKSLDLLRLRQYLLGQYNFK